MKNIEKVKKNNIRVYDSNKTKIAHLVEFCDDDLANNKLDNFNLRATHLSYIVGEVKKENDKYVFIDTISENLDKYLYFETLSQAEAMLMGEYDKSFVLHGISANEYGVSGKKYKDEFIIDLTSKMKSLFNFEVDNVLQKVKTK